MRNDRILLAHGSGGKLSGELVRGVFAPAFANPALNRMDDSAVLDGTVSLQPADDTRMPTASRQQASAVRGRLAVTTDSHVVKPLFFRGGDIGKLAVCGTVNDLSMVGARPLYLTAAFILEEGLEIDILRRVVASMRIAAEEAGVAIVAGDTKVVEQGGADGMYITTAGVGIVADGVSVSGANLRAGDAVILSGPIGEHGIAVVSQREGLEFDSPVSSDVAPLNHLVKAMLDTCPETRALRDPTRGGLGTTLNELAAQSGCAIQIEEKSVKVSPQVQAACEMLGFDPLYVANEGKLVAVVPPSAAEKVVAAMKRVRNGENAAVVGTVLEGTPGRVTLRTHMGGTRIVQMLMGDLLPRIC